MQMSHGRTSSAAILALSLATWLGCTPSSSSNGPTIDSTDGAPLPPLVDPTTDARCWGKGKTASSLIGPTGIFEGGVGAWVNFQMHVTLPSGQPGTLGQAVVLFGDVPSKVGSFDDTKGTLAVIVPDGAQSGPLSVGYGCQLFTGLPSFIVDEQPAAQVTAMLPATATPGTIVTLQGAHFTAAYGVTVGGGSVDFNVIDDAMILVQIDADAGSGPVGVTTPSGTSYSNLTETVSP